MQAIATDGVAWSVCVCVSVSVCLLVTFMSPAKTVETIEMPFGGWFAGLRNGCQGQTNIFAVQINPFTAGRGYKSAMQLFINIISPLVYFFRILSHLHVFLETYYARDPHCSLLAWFTFCFCLYINETEAFMSCHCIAVHVIVCIYVTISSFS